MRGTAAQLVLVLLRCRHYYLKVSHLKQCRMKVWCLRVYCVGEKGTCDSACRPFNMLREKRVQYDIARACMPWRSAIMLLTPCLNGNRTCPRREDNIYWYLSGRLSWRVWVLQQLLHFNEQTSFNVYPLFVPHASYNSASTKARTIEDRGSSLAPGARNNRLYRTCCVLLVRCHRASFFQPVYLDKLPSEPFKMDEPAPLIEDRYVCIFV